MREGKKNNNNKCTRCGIKEAQIGDLCKTCHKEIKDFQRKQNAR